MIFGGPMTRFILILVLAFGVVACAGKDKMAATEKPVEQLYAEARKAFADKDYQTAAGLFDEVERQHPYSQWATQSKLMSGYASYQAGDYATAVGTLGKFIELHPGHPDVAYAYYLRAICYYEQIVDVGRDQDLTRKAMEGFDDVMRRFPESKYARDAKFKRDLTVDHLAGKEMEIGRFYLKRKHYQAAINRFKTVVDKYQTTSHVPEALHRMVEAYVALGLRDEAKRIASVLGHNHPSSDWYKASYSLVTTGKTLQIKPKKKAPATTADAVKNSVIELFE
jgi:outer membrane protein assembly factor BamD